ncbi:MAG: helix-turn-helix transcriptional regulator [Nitrospira sp.]|nr:helix-turn-helix transcriptional regulator [Nitrospira sp.]
MRLFTLFSSSAFPVSPLPYLTSSTTISNDGNFISIIDLFCQVEYQQNASCYFGLNLSIFYSNSIQSKVFNMSKGVEKLVGVSIARIRKDRELTQAQLAEMIDTTVETISRLERGVSVPSLKTLEKISKALHIHIKELLTFEYPSLRKPSIKEGEKLLAYLQTKKPEDIRMCYRILKNIFEQIEKNYQLKK